MPQGVEVQVLSSAPPLKNFQRLFIKTLSSLSFLRSHFFICIYSYLPDADYALSMQAIPHDHCLNPLNNQKNLLTRTPDNKFIISIYFYIKYEHDENKSHSNKEKHGIDFEKAKALWTDDRLLETEASFSTEKRCVNIGKTQNKFYTVVATYREGRIRIISARRSSQKEIEIYES